MIQKQIKIVISIAMIGFLGACKNKTTENSSNYDTTSAETVGGAISGIAAASDSGGSIVALQPLPEKKPSLLKSVGTLAKEIIESKAQAASCSSTITVAGAACGGVGGTVMTLNLGGCSGSLGGTWTGTDTLTYSSAAACSNASSGGLINIGAGNSVTLTSASGITLTAPSSFSVVSDSGSSGYASTVSGGTRISCGDGGCTSNRSVNILGVHRRLLGPAGATLFDHSLSTPTAFTISGVGAAKQITAGSLQLQHNIARYTATSQITQALTFSAGCCYPTGGQITNTFSNGKSGSETVTFGPSCGAASVNGNSVTLSYCQ